MNERYSLVVFLSVQSNRFQFVAIEETFNMQQRFQVKSIIPVIHTQRVLTSTFPVVTSHLL